MATPVEDVGEGGRHYDGDCWSGPYAIRWPRSRIWVRLHFVGGGSLPVPEYGTVRADWAAESLLRRRTTSSSRSSCIWS